MIHSFPKIFALGTKYVKNIFDGEVNISEKVDGSQMSFGKINGELEIRSKNKKLYVDNPEKMFSAGIEYIESIKSLLPEGLAFHCEYLKAPKHNSLTYARIPKNHLMLYGIRTLQDDFIPALELMADTLGIEVVPTIFEGLIANPEEVHVLMNQESVLGRVKIEGLVVKNYNKPFLLGGQVIPLMMGKLVSEAFKEVHRANWNEGETRKSRLDGFLSSFCTEARWRKSIQSLRDRGELLEEPKDIGPLLKEIHLDIQEEEKENIKDWLWGEFSKELKRRSTKGFVEFYKKEILKESF